jgi:uncharacterized protein with ParB-like and HNH nuclease domain
MAFLEAHNGEEHAARHEHTVNTSELLGNGKIYRVPPFQRDYSWTEEHCEDLWNDIRAVRSGEERKHYMGTVVLQAKSDKEFSIIDGQQRLTTMSLIAIAVIKHREVENKDFTAKRAAYAKSQFKLTQAIQNEEWTPAAVTARQEQMAARAAHVWRSDFE